MNLAAVLQSSEASTRSSSVQAHTSRAWCVRGFMCATCSFKTCYISRSTGLASFLTCSNRACVFSVVRISRLQDASAGPAHQSAEARMTVQRAPLARSFKAAPQPAAATRLSPVAARHGGDAASAAAGIEPKVHASFKMVPGHAPRRIEIERKKRLFASQNIEVRARLSFHFIYLLICFVHLIIVIGICARRLSSSGVVARAAH